MPRVVPSEIVRFIDHQLGPAKAQEEQPINRFSLDWTYRGPLRALLRFLDELPRHLITVTDADYYLFVSAREAVQGMVDEWSSGDHGKSLDKLPGTSGLNPVTVIRRTLRQCPDSFPTPGQTKFSFVSDLELRANFDDDNGAIERAVANSEWKGATVLAGALIEALLLWAFSCREKAKPGDTSASAKRLKLPHAADPLVEWVLDELMKVAGDLKLLRLATVKEVSLAKDFRNLIHAGRSQRLRQPCDRATAYHTVAALDHTADDVRKWVDARMP